MVGDNCVAMKTIVRLIGGGCAALLAGCITTATRDDIVGRWLASNDGAVLEFLDSGRFSAKSLPGYLLFGPGHEAERLDGAGTWGLREGPMGTEVELGFDAIGDRHQGFGIPIKVAGRGASMRLFFWKGQEGGERFEFEKQREVGTSDR